MVADQRRSPGIVAQLTGLVGTPLRLAYAAALLLPSRRPVGRDRLTIGADRRHLLAGELHWSVGIARCSRERRRDDRVGIIGRFYSRRWRSEEHTSELQSLMRNSYAVFCLKKKKKRKPN